MWTFHLWSNFTGVHSSMRSNILLCGDLRAPAGSIRIITVVCFCMQCIDDMKKIEAENHITGTWKLLLLFLLLYSVSQAAHTANRNALRTTHDEWNWFEQNSCTIEDASYVSMRVYCVALSKQWFLMHFDYAK